MAMVTFVDETTAGDRGTAWQLEMAEEQLTLREIIRRRVYREVAEHNAAGGDHFRGLVQPGDTERTRDGFRMSKHRQVDAEEQFSRAVQAFSRNGFVVLVDDRQVEDLDSELPVHRAVEVTFLKLVPLVGG
ncbi:hypothetical protein AB0B31_12625 [Catellatospora citrea]|uniref:hypothetical protein n=1 Tax=Catellatospora citrea TaxID=53366 RepID=UPI0033DD1079